MTKMAKVTIGAMLVGMSIAGGSMAAIAQAQQSVAACPGTVNPETFKCEEGNCGIGESCCGCVD
jgi:hypothetical protein